MKDYIDQINNFMTITNKDKVTMKSDMLHKSFDLMKSNNEFKMIWKLFFKDQFKRLKDDLKNNNEELNILEKKRVELLDDLLEKDDELSLKTAIDLDRFKIILDATPNEKYELFDKKNDNQLIKKLNNLYLWLDYARKYVNNVSSETAQKMFYTYIPQLGEYFKEREEVIKTLSDDAPKKQFLLNIDNIYLQHLFSTPFKKIYLIPNTQISFQKKIKINEDDFYLLSPLKNKEIEISLFSKNKLIKKKKIVIDTKRPSTSHIKFLFETFARKENLDSLNDLVKNGLYSHLLDLMTLISKMDLEIDEDYEVSFSHEDLKKIESYRENINLNNIYILNIIKIYKNFVKSKKIIKDFDENLHQNISDTQVFLSKKYKHNNIQLMNKLGLIVQSEINEIIESNNLNDEYLDSYELKTILHKTLGMYLTEASFEMSFKWGNKMKKSNMNLKRYIIYMILSELGMELNSKMRREVKKRGLFSLVNTNKDIDNIKNLFSYRYIDLKNNIFPILKKLNLYKKQLISTYNLNPKSKTYSNILKKLNETKKDLKGQLVQNVMNKLNEILSQVFDENVFKGDFRKALLKYIEYETKYRTEQIIESSMDIGIISESFIEN
tara:strand:+ start:152 stop:1975 length:1824 start_codon:yes stop_codon:yes gene_type:complete